MPRSSAVQTNFTAGEISPRLWGQNELTKYRNGVRAEVNFLSQKHGGATRRPGTIYVDEVFNSGTLNRLIPHQFSINNTYIFELGGGGIVPGTPETPATPFGTMRIYRDRGRLLLDAETLGTPWNDDALPGLKWAQSADIQWVCAPPQLVIDNVNPDLRIFRDTEVYTIARNAEESEGSIAGWPISAFRPDDGPFMPNNVRRINQAPDFSITMQVVRDSGDVFIDCSVPIFTSPNLDTSGNRTDNGDELRLIRIQGAATFSFFQGGWGWARIAEVVTSQRVRVTEIAPFSPAAEFPSSTWALGAWSDSTGYPRSVGIHQGRLWFGNSRSQPQTLWASRTSNFYSFQPTEVNGEVFDDHALNFTLDDDRVNAIQWISSGHRGLQVFTDASEYVLSADVQFRPITPTNVGAIRYSTWGSAERVRPARVSNTMLFTTNPVRKVREFTFAFESDAFVAPDMTLLAEHITFGGLEDADYQQEPDSIYWARRCDGVLLGLTIERNQEVVAWHRHEIGGEDGTNPYGFVESIAIIRNRTTKEDEVWMIVRRDIEGVSENPVRYVEIMMPQFVETLPCECRT